MSDTVGTAPHAAPDRPDDSTERHRPNVVLILVDDMGFGDLGCYGNQQIKTPNIDRLAAEGVRFERYYSSAPICSPTRVASSCVGYTSTAASSIARSVSS